MTIKERMENSIVLVVVGASVLAFTAGYAAALKIEETGGLVAVTKVELDSLRRAANSQVQVTRNTVLPAQDSGALRNLVPGNTGLSKERDSRSYDFDAAWRVFDDSLVQYYRQNPTLCDETSKAMRIRAGTRLERINGEAVRAHDTAQLERVRSERLHAATMQCI